MLIFSGKVVIFLLRYIVLCENRKTTGSATHTHTHTHTHIHTGIYVSRFGHLHGAVVCRRLLTCGLMFYWTEWKGLQSEVIAYSTVRAQYSEQQRNNYRLLRRNIQRESECLGNESHCRVSTDVSVLGRLTAWKIVTVNAIFTILDKSLVSACMYCS